MFVEVWLPSALKKSRNMCVQPSPCALFRIWNGRLRPTVFNQPSHGSGWIELKVDPFGFAADDVKRNAASRIRGLERRENAPRWVSGNAGVSDRAKRDRKIRDDLKFGDPEFAHRKISGGS